MREQNLKNFSKKISKCTSHEDKENKSKVLKIEIAEVVFVGKGWKVEDKLN